MDYHITHRQMPEKIRENARNKQQGSHLESDKRPASENGGKKVGVGRRELLKIHSLPIARQMLQITMP